MIRSLRAAAVAALFVAAAACSQTGGFGAPAPYPNVPPAGGAQTQGRTQTNAGQNVSPQPGSSASPSAAAGETSAPASPSSQPSGSPLPPAVTIDNAFARLTYDGAAADPAKTQRLLELSFVVKNTTDKAAAVRKVNLNIENQVLAIAAVAITAPASQSSRVATLVLKTDLDFAKSATLKIILLDAKSKMLTSADVDLAGAEISFTPLDAKQPAPPGVSVEGVDVSRVDFVSGTPRYVVTFALTNGGKSKVPIDRFSIAPPKGAATNFNLAIIVPPRSTSGFISVVLSYDGKSLPAGSYKVSALGSGTGGKATTLATGSGPLL